MPDIFICHASEDKDAVARPIAEALIFAGLEVWYDEFSLKLGDSLRRSIDNGLANSKYGVVILSHSFFVKDWPQEELNGLFAKEIGREKTILPVWHNISREEILRHSPIMADRVSVKTEDGLDLIVKKILDVVTPDSSHLTLDRKTLAVSPNFIRLHTGSWAVKTPIQVFNLSDMPAYSVAIKVTPEPSNLNIKSIAINIGQPTTSVEESLGSISISPDATIYHLIDSVGREVLVIVLHTIVARSSREISLSGTIVIESSATVELWDFKLNPPEAYNKDQAAAFPIMFPEDVKIKDMALFSPKKRM